MKIKYTPTDCFFGDFAHWVMTFCLPTYTKQAWQFGF